MKKAIREIEKALARLGYRKFDFHCEVCGHNRYVVFVNNDYFGIYDYDRHTFVD